MISILTRTCGRHNYFDACKKSLEKQNRKYRHIIGSDIGDGEVNYTRREKTNQTKKIDGMIHNHTPYNLYLNDLIKATKTKFAIILDDDDQFELGIALELIEEKIKEGADFIRRQTKFPSGLVPQIHDPTPGPRLGNYNIASCGFCFDVRTAKTLEIGEWSGCDGKFGWELYRLAKNPVFIPHPLTGIQLEKGWGNNGSLSDKI